MKKYNNNLYNLINRVWNFSTNMFLILVLTLSCYSCDDFVDVELPNSQLTADDVFEDPSTANSALTQIYANIRKEGILTGSTTGISHLLANYSDEMIFFGSSGNSAVAFYNNSLIASNNTVRTLWNTSYNQIYSANAIIEGVENSVSLSTSDRDLLKGEALFIRAIIHFYLLNLYGDVPYIRTTDYEVNRKVSRNTVSQVYNFIKNDLALASQLLQEDYLTIDRTRPNKYTVDALLARVNLYEGLWDEAIIEASIVINNTQLYVHENLSTMFLKESKSTIWQLDPGFNGGYALESNTFNFTIGPPPLSALTNSFINAFNVNDQRKVHWTKAVTDGTTTWHHPYKYKSSAASPIEYSIIFRLSEMYLIRAEARAQSGDLSGAKEDLNVIRSNAGLLNTTAITQSEILDAILKERQFELFTEFGHRFFDLKRFNKIQSVLSIVKNGWDNHNVLFPIPEREIEINPNLAPQNSGY